MKKNLFLAALVFATVGSVEAKGLPANNEKKYLMNGNLSTTPSWVFEKLKPMTENEGWDMVATKSHTWDNGVTWTWKHYESSNQAVRTLYQDNGDFITILEREDGNYEVMGIPTGYNGARPMGPVRITLDDGSVFEAICPSEETYGMGFRCLFRYRFTNGTIVFGWTQFFDLKSGIFYYEKERQELIKEIKKAEFEVREGGDDQCKYLYVTLPEDSTKCYKMNTYMFQKGNKTYYLTDTGWPHTAKQEVDGVQFYCLDSDTITSIKDNVVTYANGDQLTYTRISGLGRFNQLGIAEDVTTVTGSIHRMGGVLKVSMMNGRLRCRLTLPNGDYFTGTFKEQYAPDRFDDNLLMYTTLTPYNGIWNRGGQTEQITKGMSKADYDRAEANKQAMADAAKKAKYDKLCAKYGKKYVDAAYDCKIIIGMPEELFTTFFKTSLDYQSAYAKRYCLSNALEAFAANARVVWVSGGRVTDIIW